MRVWNVETDEGSINIFGVEGSGNVDCGACVAISPDGRFIAAGTPDASVLIWDLTTGALSRRLAGHCGGVPCISFTPDGDVLVSGSLDRTLKMWNLTALRQDDIIPTTSHGSEVEATIPVIDTSEINEGAVVSVMANDDAEEEEDERRRGALTLAGHNDAVHAVAVTHNGRWVVSGSYDSTVRFWDRHTGAEQFTLEGHRSPSAPLAFNLCFIVKLLIHSALSVH